MERLKTQELFIGLRRNCIGRVCRVFFWGGGKRENNIIARYYNKKLVQCYGIFIGNHCKVGEGLRLPHPNGIIIGEYVKIGDNCTIYQQTTLGAKSIEAWKKRSVRNEYPVLEDGVIIYAGSKVIGAVRVAENTRIGANSVLLRDTEKDSVYAGVPAKRIR
ncbi:MAG: serine acetyltransferase [Clostridium sp.]|nr:serine acetyltransferase [Clostridium sp.]